MSMSQEEIEALMSGADDIHIDETEDSTTDEVVEDTVTEEPIAQEEESQEPEANLDEDVSSATPVVEETNDSDTTESDTKDESSEDVNVDELLAGIDGIVYDEDENSDSAADTDDLNVDDILAGIDGIKDDEPKSTLKDEESLEDKINSNQYPMPVNDENKVVHQLNQVADDSEAKASQIFDVLSFILDENAEIANQNKQISEFIEKQAELLESLSTKFPNVNIFSENFEEAKKLMDVSVSLASKVESENNKVFEAMELMQYHDINRQKIERVMAVIKKLSSYLNGLFEDESGKAEVQIAKHISGDSNEIVDSDDIENLISQFSKLEE